MSANKMKLYGKQYNELTRKIFGEYVLGGNKENVILSPLSIIVLMAIAAGATDGETKAEIAEMLKGDLPQNTALELIAHIQKELTGSEGLKSSNAVIVNSKIEASINPAYRDQLAGGFGGELFCTDRIVDELNAWVKKKTNGMIKQIANESMNRMMAALINAVAFQADWKAKYDPDQIEDGEFTNADGTISEVSMLFSMEHSYIENKYFTGFTKMYKGDQFSFMALLPKKPHNERLLRKAIKTVDFTELFQTAHHTQVSVTMPEFSAEFETDLKDIFKEMGIEKIFSDYADFSPLSSAWLKADSVLHKAKIEVDRNGTRAAAATAIEIYVGSAPCLELPYVYLNRPFVYAIMHNESGLPVFTGG